MGVDMNRNGSSLPIKALIVSSLLALSVPVAATHPRRSAAKDRQALADLENEWLHAHDAPTLNRILSADFVHPVPTGDFLTKQQHIDWNIAHPPPPGMQSKFADMRIRVYGNTGIANGTVIATRADGTETRKTVFTDVFVYRDGRWQAVNAQENVVSTAGLP